MVKQICDTQKVIEDFKKTRSFTETGKLNSISKQRVDQIIEENKIEIKAKGAHLQWIGKQCSTCNRVMGKEVKHGTGNICSSCFSFSKSKGKHHLYRTLFYPKNCIDCNVKFTKEIRPQSNGRCKRCAEKTPERRAKTRAYMRKYLQTPKGKAMTKRNNANSARKKKLLVKSS